ncbi:nucleotidyltransferase domain-containing protein [Rubrivirga sp. IMCC45206]|uniref:nucleotidyltransferase domain-containing protein n=1 Tax=Rubrivirga sp. IMCC45206 TaxID=3391614 RepID=UPI0039902F52
MTGTLPPSTPPHVRAALAEAKARLVALYGDRLDRVVLYGSRARGDARPDSDVDLLVVLRGGYEASLEIKERLLPVALDALDTYGLHVSMQPFSAEEVADERRPFMRNATADGVEL